MRRTVYLILSIVFTTMLLVNCGQDKGKDTKTGILNLKFNDWVPDGLPATLLWKDVAAKIAANTKDRIKITNYLAGTLVKFPETFKGISTGVADISNYVLGSAPGVHDLTEIFDLPFLGFKDYDQAFRIYNEIINEFPEIQEENAKKGVRILSIRPFDPYWIHSVKKPVKLPADMKGQKAIATGYSSFLASSNGGLAMQTGPIDWYSGLQKGVVQHIITNWAPFGQFKLYEVAKIHTKFGEAGITNNAICVLININTWNKLSAEEQKVIVEAYSWYQGQIAKSDLDLANNFITKAKKEGHTFIELLPSEIKQWKDSVGKQAAESWLTKVEAKGKPARKLYEAIQAKIAKYQ